MSHTDSETGGPERRIRETVDYGGRRLASASLDETVKIWDTRTGNEVLTLRGQTPTYNVTFSVDGKRLACASDGGIVRVWDATPLSK